MNCFTNNNMGPLISVIIPVYNAERYIKEMLNSVLGQSYTNWNLLIIDDGSTDNTKVICQRFMIDRRVHFVEKQNGKEEIYLGH